LGGPRSALGKERTKYNARTHGIFAKFVVLEGESQEEFDALLNGLREDYLPVGTSEEVHVELMACNLWRRRRHLLAEGVEIEKARLALEWGEKERQMSKATDFSAVGHGEGLIREIDNPEALDVSIVRLGTLKMLIDSEGIDLKRDTPTLTALYGALEEGHWQLDLHHSYEGIAATASLSGEIHKRPGLPSPEQCKSELLRLIDSEIERIRLFQEERQVMASKRMTLEGLCQSVPDATTLLDRHATTLERSFDRDFGHLDRAQRTRLGKPVAPRIEVNVSSS
jgi:hypothetical protein